MGVTVADLERSIRFWEGLLGQGARDRRVLEGPQLGRLVGYPRARIDSCWIDLPGGVALELLHYLERDDAAQHAGTAHPGSVHVCLHVADMEAARGRALASGARPVGDGPIEVPAGPRAGTRITYVTDPDGVTIELVQPPPG